VIKKEIDCIINTRNYGFLHIYVLEFYWRHKDKNVLPPNLNYYMEFEYGLIGQALSIISKAK
jgi:hypothetical protein